VNVRVNLGSGEEVGTMVEIEVQETEEVVAATWVAT
jgi:hypothetical protein